MRGGPMRGGQMRGGQSGLIQLRIVGVIDRRGAVELHLHATGAKLVETIGLVPRRRTRLRANNSEPDAVSIDGLDASCDLRTGAKPHPDQAPGRPPPLPRIDEWPVDAGRTHLKDVRLLPQDRVGRRQI